MSRSAKSSRQRRQNKCKQPKTKEIYEQNKLIKKNYNLCLDAKDIFFVFFEYIYKSFGGPLGSIQQPYTFKFVHSICEEGAS